MPKPIDPLVYAEVYKFTEWLESEPDEVIINGHLVGDIVDLLMAVEDANKEDTR